MRKPMHRLLTLSLVLALAMPAAAAASEAADAVEEAVTEEMDGEPEDGLVVTAESYSGEASLTEKRTTLYLGSTEDVRTIGLYFEEEDGVPYVRLVDFAYLMNVLCQGEEYADPVGNFPEDIRFHLVYDLEDDVAYLSKQDGYAAFFDVTDDVISFLDYDAFMRLSDSKYLIDILSVDEPRPDEDVVMFHRCPGSYERYGESVTLNLRDYGIEMFSDGTDCYVPLQTLSDFLLSPFYFNAFYNGAELFIAPYEGFMTEDYELTELGELYYSVEPSDRSPQLAEFTYAELCLALDHLYGLKDTHAIDSFDDLATETGLKEDLLSEDQDIADRALYQLLTFHLDDNHSYFSMVSPRNGEGTAENYLMEYGYGLSREQYDRLSALYREARAAVYPDGVPVYDEFGNTAFITFDGFNSIPAGTDYYLSAPTADVKDTIGIMLYAYAQITREDSPIENIVLDLSCNSGGDVDTAIFTIASFLGIGSVSVKDTLSGAIAMGRYAVDTNLDGEFDDNDDGFQSRNLFCLISPLSFSCGNLVPSVFKNSDLVTLVGRASGGGSCLVLPLSTADGTVFQISGSSRLSFMKNGSFYDIDQGVEPDIPLMKPESYYDREALAAYLGGIR